MGRKFYDDFSKEPIDKMAQSMVDMSFAYNETRIPKKHFKNILEKEIIELASLETNIETALLKPYYDMIGQMIKENKKYFIKALLLHELNIKYSSLDSLNLQALSLTWDFIEDNKIKTVIDKEIKDIFQDYIKNGLLPKESGNQN